MLKKLIPADWLKGYEGWALIPLRLALAAVFTAHGGQKLFVWEIAGTAAGFEHMGFHPGIFWGTLVALVEFFGGIGTFWALRRDGRPWPSLLICSWPPSRSTSPTGFS